MLNDFQLNKIALAPLGALLLLGSAPVLPQSKSHLPVYLRLDMPYSQARASLLKAGWQHERLPAYGYNSRDQKVISECYQDALICNTYPEIGYCSSQGYCAMFFHDLYGNRLRITTYGQLMTRKLHVIGWLLNPDKESEMY
jgi:hypothetical protein